MVEPAWGRDLSKLPPGVSRIVGGARKLFEVRCHSTRLAHNQLVLPVTRAPVASCCQQECTGSEQSGTSCTASLQGTDAAYVGQWAVPLERVDVKYK